MSTLFGRQKMATKKQYLTFEEQMSKVQMLLVKTVNSHRDPLVSKKRRIEKALENKNLRPGLRKQLLQNLQDLDGRY